MPAPGAPTGTARRRTLSKAPSAARQKQRLLWSAAAVVLTAIGLAAFYWFVLADHNRHHEFPVTWPKDAPTGEIVPVHHAVQAGDVFVTTLTFDSSLLLGFTYKLKDGMKLDGELTIAQQVLPKDGGGLKSHVKVLLERCDATHGPMKEAVWKALRDRQDPYALDFDRQPSGRPDRKSARGAGATPLRRQVLDSITSGLGDLVTTWLPDHDVRLGEAWDLLSVADLPNLIFIMTEVSKAGGPEQGFPAFAVRGMGAAEAVETRDGEACLRVRIIATVSQEGDVVRPAAPGWVTSAARIDGHAWISTATGIVWALEAVVDMQSSRLEKNLATERLIQQTVRAKTVRAKTMPE